MRLKTKMMLSVACGILAVLCALIYADSVRQETEQVRTQALERYGGEVTNLVVACAGLSSGDVIKQTDVEVREWLVDLAPQEALSTLDDVVGLRLTSAVAAGAPLSRVDFAHVDGEIEIPEGRVAVSVHLSDKTGVSDTLTSGSRLLAYEVTATNTVLISNDIVVVGAKESSKTTPASSLTIAVSPALVPRILSAAADGTLRLAMPTSDVTGDVKGISSEATTETTT